MDMLLIARCFFALILVVFLIILSIGIYNRFIIKHKYFSRFLRKKKIKLHEVIVIDQHNKIIEIARKDLRHLILLGKNTEMLIETYEEIELPKLDDSK